MTLIFSTKTSKFDNEIVKLTSQITWIKIFTFQTLVWELFGVGIITNASFFFLLNICGVSEIELFSSMPIIFKIKNLLLKNSH